MSTRFILAIILCVNYLISTAQDRDKILNSFNQVIKYNPDSALLMVKRFDSLKTFSNDSEANAQFMIYKSKLYKHYNLITDAQQELFNALNIYIELNIPDKQHKTYSLIAELYKQSGISEKAKANYYKAYKIAKHTDMYSAWDYYFSMIKLNISDMDYDIALNNLDTAANEFIHKDTTNTIRPKILNTKGIVFLWVKDYESSIKVLDSAIKINISINDSINLAKNYTNIGRVYGEKGEFNTTYKYFINAYVIDSLTNNVKGLYIKGLNLASIQVRLNNYIEARNIYNKLLSIDEIKDNHEYMMRLHYSIAILYYNLDNSALMDEHTDKALEYASKINDQNHISLILDLKSKNEFYFKKNKDKGYELLKESNMIAKKTDYNKLIETIKRQELKVKIIEQEAKLNSNYKRSEEKISELESINTITQILLIAVTILSVIVILILTKRLRINQKLFSRYKYVLSSYKSKYQKANSKIGLINSEKDSINRIAEHTKNDMNKLIMLIEESNKITQNCIQIVNKDISKSGLDKLIKNIKRLDAIISDNDIIKFHLDNEYSEFNVKLNEHFSSLTKGEIQLCTLIRYNYSTNQIASYTNTSQKTIEVARYRLRKKLGFDSNTDFYNFINNI